jgi:hypothetical protein
MTTDPDKMSPDEAIEYCRQIQELSGEVLLESA